MKEFILVRIIIILAQIKYYDRSLTQENIKHLKY